MNLLDFDHLDKLIADDNLEEVLNILRRTKVESEEVIALSARLSDLKRNAAIRGNWPSEDATITKNQIRTGVQELLKKLKESRPSALSLNKSNYQKRQDGVVETPVQQSIRSFDNAMKMKKTFPNSFIPQQEDSGFITIEYLNTLKTDCETVWKKLDNDEWNWDFVEDRYEAIRLLSRLDNWFEDLSEIFDSLSGEDLPLHDQVKGIIGPIQITLDDLENDHLKSLVRTTRLSSKTSVLAERLENICRELENMIDIARENNPN